MVISQPGWIGLSKVHARQKHFRSRRWGAEQRVCVGRPRSEDPHRREWNFYKKGWPWNLLSNLIQLVWLFNIQCYCCDILSFTKYKLGNYLFGVALQLDHFFLSNVPLLSFSSLLILFQQFSYIGQLHRNICQLHYDNQETSLTCPEIRVRHERPA